MTDTTEITLWDLPTRLFHWGLVGTIAVCWVSGELLDDAMTLHIWAGYCALALLLFRVMWGFFGSETARFSQFVTSPPQVAAYVRTLLQRKPGTHAGHNPLGGWSVLVLLALSLTVTVSGLFSNDEVSTWGPLAHRITPDLSDRLSDMHGIAFNVLAGVIALHVLAVLFYRLYKRDNLILPMITGRKPVSAAVPRPALASNGRALLLFTVAAAAVALLPLLAG